MYYLFFIQIYEDCPLDCNLTEITQIQVLPGQFGTCTQQCETSLLIYQEESKYIIFILISAPGVLQFITAKMIVLSPNLGQK